MSSLNRHVALVSESERVGPGALMRVAAALQKQAVRDLGPLWNVAATVDAFQALEDVPLDYWPVVIRDDIDYAGAAGIHLDEDGQPFALVTASDDEDVWSLTASHEVIEMLVDPFGNRLVAGDSPKPDQGRVQFLVEACDPSEDRRYAYSVNGVLVSDFYTPHYFDPVAAPGVRYSYTGALTAPRQVLVGGYLSWQDLQTRHWWQATWFSGPQPAFRDLGVLKGQGSLRSQLDRLSMADTLKAIEGGRVRHALAGLTAAAAAHPAAARAQAIQARIQAILAAPAPGNPGG